METATITEVKNGLSAIIDRVKAGESVVVTDRGVPVAVIEPMSAHVEVDDRLARLERAGIIKRGRGKVPLELLRTPGPTPRGGGNIAVEYLLEERREGR
ncbi:MAG TPA: type II toxin-antitoxin system prevent-host-death family antitoxin [Candidatus Limnocylindrales bacterium]